MIPEAIEKCRRKGLYFYALRMPESDRLNFGASRRLIDGTGTEGFAVAPFGTGREKAITIPADYEAGELSDTIESSVSRVLPETADTSIGEHRSGVLRIVQELKKSGRSKAVLSRVMTVRTSRRAGDIFSALCEAYPAAAVFCFSVLPGQCWIGATPELLLENDGRSLRSMSLAGTRPHGKNAPWDAKNIEEQQIVTDIIMNDFRSLGLSPEASPVFTRPAGPVEHLCSRITASLPPEASSALPFELATRMAPTPALGGWPRDVAMRLIAETERHDRGCYGGYFGPVNAEGRFRFFVTLRCARIAGESATLYAGGGITRFSDPDAEWKETEMKLSTLRRFF